jgi:hypothetical protein
MPTRYWICNSRIRLVWDVLQGIRLNMAEAHVERTPRHNNIHSMTTLADDELPCDGWMKLPRSAFTFSGTKSLVPDRRFPPSRRDLRLRIPAPPPKARASRAARAALAALSLASLAVNTRHYEACICCPASVTLSGRVESVRAVPSISYLEAYP